MEDTTDNNIRLRGGSIEGSFNPLRVGKENWRKPSIKKPLYGKIPKTFGQPTTLPKGDAYEVKPLPDNTKTHILLLAYQESQLVPNTKVPLNITRFRPKAWSRSPREKQLFAILEDNRELGKGKWMPTRNRPELHLPRPDEFASSHYTDKHTHLFLKAEAFCKEYFGYGDFRFTPQYGEPPAKNVDPVIAEEWEGPSPWPRVKFSEQFLHYASLVAKQDVNCGGWDVLLTSGSHRLYMAIGIIARVLQNTVFDDLLFGANEAQRKLLDAVDEQTPDFDGFETTKIRAELFRNFLKESADQVLTPEFWPSVDRVTAQLAKILIPLLDLMDAEFRHESKGKDIRNFYQELHNLVSAAGLHALNIRWSRDIFRFDWPTLGLAWALEQENYDHDIFMKSYHENHQRRNEAIRWAEHQRQREADEAARYPGGKKPPPSWLGRGWERLKKRVFGDPDEINFETGLSDKVIDKAWTRPDFLNKVQIVLWPALYRHSRGAPENKEASGVTVTAVDKSLCVYYCGRIDAVGQWVEMNEDRLQEWVEKKKLESKLFVLRFLQFLLTWLRFFFALAIVLNFSALFILGIVRVTGWDVAVDVYQELKDLNSFVWEKINDAFLWCLIMALWTFSRFMSICLWSLYVCSYINARFWSWATGAKMAEAQVRFGNTIYPTIVQSFQWGIENVDDAIDSVEEFFDGQQWIDMLGL